jgi:hypothetical protein
LGYIGIQDLLTKVNKVCRKFNDLISNCQDFGAILRLIILLCHCSLDKIGYNVIWNEQVAGRGSNKLASAVTVILENALKAHPHVKKITLWYDSCVPQNRNSMMTTAL